MEKFHKYQRKSGYSEVVGDSSGLELTRFGLIELEPGESLILNSGEFEIGLVLMAGACDISCDGEKFTGLKRSGVFTAKAAAVYIPRDSKYEVKAQGSGRMEIGVCKVKADRKLKPFVVRPEETETVHRGQLNWQRDAVDIFTGNAEGRVDKIVLGETYGLPGQWSSYPSHKHDRDNPPVEVRMEEIYHFKANPPQGFGVQVLYNDDRSTDESYVVRNGDTVAIGAGYHPVAAAPGYQMYYLWTTAGRSGRVLTPFGDPKHVWIRAVEKMI